jgi:hypothetical protein
MSYGDIVPGTRDNTRKFPKIKGVRPDHKEDRRLDAAERAEARAARSAEQQLDVLDRRLGVDVGAAKERKRLTAVAIVDIKHDKKRK